MRKGLRVRVRLGVRVRGGNLLLIILLLLLISPLPSSAQGVENVRVNSGTRDVLNTGTIDFAAGQLRIGESALALFNDGDKGDITVSGSGATWNIDSGVINFSELAGTASIAQVSGLQAALDEKLEDSHTPAFLMTGYLEGEGKLRMLMSADGLKWSPIGSGMLSLIYDPSITYHNGRWWLASTGDEPFTIWSSPDLINWTLLDEADRPDFSSIGVYQHWAPEWFIDDDGTVRIYVSSTIPPYPGSGAGTTFRIYETHALNDELTEWSAPVEVLGILGVIDPFVFKDGSTYHMLYKNETGQYVEWATASSPTGPFTTIRSGDWAGWGVREGVCLFKLSDTHWRIHVEHWPGIAQSYTDSYDSGATWSPLQEINTSALTGTGSLKLRHTTVTALRTLAERESVLYAERTLRTPSLIERPVRTTEPSLVLSPTFLSSSRRVGLELGTWALRQDRDANGTLNFALWNGNSGTNALWIDANGRFNLAGSTGILGGLSVGWGSGSAAVAAAAGTGFFGFSNADGSPVGATFDNAAGGGTGIKFSNSVTGTTNRWQFFAAAVSGDFTIGRDGLWDAFKINRTTQQITVGTGITLGTNGAIAFSGTGAATTRTNLGLVVGTDVQAYDADLASWAGVTRATGFDAFAATPTLANLNTLVSDADVDSLMPLAQTEVSVTGATTATIGRMHVCSGTTADYTVTLPTAVGNAGKQLAFRMASGLTKLVTLDGNGSETIDGTLTRVMWAQESATLLSDGAQWVKIAGRSRPMKAKIKANATQSISNTTVTVINLPATTYDDGAIANTGSNRVVIRRAGTYALTGFVTLNMGGAAASRFIGYLRLNGNQQALTEISIAAGGDGHLSPASTESLAVNDYIDLAIYQQSGGARNTFYHTSGGLAGLVNALAVTEIPEW